MSSQTPYIGSKISLISKLDIRYEGVLYSVNTTDSTIALIKVRSFGTEDRQTANPVAARDDVYEHIIFKASDIKDLIVCETPKTPNLGGLPYDPAIVAVSNRPEPLSASSSRANTPHRVSPGAEAAPVNRAPGAGRSGSQQLQPRPAHGPPRGGQQGPYVSQRLGGYQQTFSRGGGGYGVPHSLINRGGVRGGFVRNNQGHAREKVRYESDYDFEKANEQFQETLSELIKDKLNIGDKSPTDAASGDHNTESEEGKNSEDGDANFYDKSNSFFDRISCEALEKAEGRKTRPDWRKERETNQETFGHQAVRSLSYRRGYGRGRGGPGGGRFNGFNGYQNGYRYNNYQGGSQGYGRGGGFRRPSQQQQAPHQQGAQ